MHGSAEQPEEEPGPTGVSPEGSDSIVESSEAAGGSSEADDISAWVSRICQGFDLPGQKASPEPEEEEELPAAEEELPAAEEVAAQEPVESQDASELEDISQAEPVAAKPLELPKEAEQQEPETILEGAQEAAPAEEPVAEEPVAEEPVAEEPVAEAVRVIELEAPSLESAEAEESGFGEPEQRVEGEEPQGPELAEQAEDRVDEVRIIKLDPALTMDLGSLKESKEAEPYEGEALSLQLGPQATSLQGEQEQDSDEQTAADTLLLGIAGEPEEMFELSSESELWMPADEPFDSGEEPLTLEPVAPVVSNTAATLDLENLPPPRESPEETAVETLPKEQALPLKPEGRRHEKVAPAYPNKKLSELSLDSESFKAEKKPEKRPGGNLRSLEQALVQPVPRQLPPGIENRAIAAVGFLSTLESTQRAMVIIVNEAGELQVVVAGGMGEDSLSQTSMRLLRSVLSTNTPLLLLDCSKDARFGKDRVIVEQKIRSVVCVPFRDCVSKARGLLYADNISKPSSFNYRDLSRTEDFARTLSMEQHLGGFEHVVSPVSKPEETVEVDRAPALVPWIFVAAVSLILFMILPALSWSGSKSSKPKAAQTPLVVKHETADSETVVVAYLRALESGNFANAYLFLSPRIRAGLSQVAFQNKAKAFLETDNNAFEMSKATVIAESVEKETQRTYLIRPLRKDGTKWTWIVKKERDLWYLESFKGGLEF